MPCVLDNAQTILILNENVLNLCYTTRFLVWLSLILVLKCSEEQTEARVPNLTLPKLANTFAYHRLKVTANYTNTKSMSTHCVESVNRRIPVTLVGQVKRRHFLFGAIRENTAPVRSF